MSDWNYCHGPNCHTRHTQSRVRGVKGNKVLRTRKVTKSNCYYGAEWGTKYWHYFCDDTCMRDYMHNHIRELVAIAPRNEPLETPIEIQTVQDTDWRGNPYTYKKIVQPD